MKRSNALQHFARMALSAGASVTAGNPEAAKALGRARQEYSGSPLFDEFVQRGCSPEAFNRAYAHFTVRNPTSDFGEAVASVAAETTPTKRVAMSVDLFGRVGAEIVPFCTDRNK